MDATRRDFLAAIGALGLAGLSSENGSRLVLLHTNDIHGHLTAWRGWEGDLKDRQIGGLDRLAAAVLQIRQDNARTEPFAGRWRLLGRYDDRRSDQGLCPGCRAESPGL